MSIEIGKIGESKRRARRAGAALSFADKLRVVELLRDETINKLPKQEDGRTQSGESKDRTPKSLLREMIRHTVEKQIRRKEVVSDDDRKQLATEVEELFSQKELGLEVLRVLFPEGIPIGVTFYDRLTDLEMRLGWDELSHRAIGLLLLLAVGQLPADSGETLLREMPRVEGPRFFQALDTLSVLAVERELRPEFATEWFPALVRRIGNDFASGGFWKALGTYCELHTRSALDVLHSLSTAQGEEEISVAAYILGTMRSLDLDEPTYEQFKKLETELSTGAAIGTRSIYYRSWIQTSRRGKILKLDLEMLVNRMSMGISDDREQVFTVVCRILLSPSIPEDSFRFGMDWLRTHASGTIGPTAKYNVIDFAFRLPAAWRKEAGELVLLVQPVLAEHKGIWQSIEYFLVSWLKADLSSFSSFCVELAKRNARNWLEVLEASRVFEWFLSELRGKDVGSMVGRLVLSPLADCRRLGLFFFDRLEMSALPTAILDYAGENQVQVMFYELQLAFANGRAIARYLILLIPYIQRASLGFQEVFFDELVLQLKNYPGSFREECEKRKSEFPILKKAIEEVDRYFKALSQVRQSSINAMEVTGYRRAVSLYNRQFTNEISQKSDEQSVFKQLAKNVHLLYGNSWSLFRGGKLGESSVLHQFSISIEIPHLEMIDPEGMALRRMHASAKIVELRKFAHADKGDEQA